MAVLATGTVSDRPWGQTLGALAKRGLSGQLTITADNKPYRIAFSDGAVVGATSPLTSDAAVRLAMTGGLVSSTQVSEITRRVAGSPHRDEIDVIAEAARLQPDQAQRLRRRLVAQRAARTFSLDHGAFVIDDQITIPVVPGSELDVRAVIAMGARANLSEARLSEELSALGAWFKLTPQAIAELPQFGFTELDTPVLRQLAAGANLADITVEHPQVGERGVRAIVYALATYGACEVSVVKVPAGRPSNQSPVPGLTPGQPPLHPGSRTTTPTFRGPPEASDAGEDAATMLVRRPTDSPVSNVVPPEGMSLRTPRITEAPTTRSQRSTSNPGFERAPSGSDQSGPRAATSPPSISRSTTDSHASSSTSPAVTGGARSGTGSTPAVPGGNPGAATGSHPTVSRTPTGAPPATPRVATSSYGVMPRVSPGRAATPQDIAYGRVPTPDHGEPPSQPEVGRAPTPAMPTLPRTQTPLRVRPPGEPLISRTTSQSRAAPLPTASRAASPQVGRPRTNTAATNDTDTLIRERLALVERSADHFNLLGISQDATPDMIRAAYFTLARKLHPDRLASLGIHDRDSQRLMAIINAAFAVLNDTVKRTEYASILSRGGESAVRAEEAKADELAMRVMHAEEAFRRGEMALRRDQLETAMKEFTMAVELQPQEPEYQALFTWTKFAAATDKQAIAPKTRTELQRAAERSEQSPTARFYLGRVERILGREREALEHFRGVIRIKPNHQEASSEVRVLEARLKKR